MIPETLDASFYRERARLCHALAESATVAKPFFARLSFLAKGVRGESSGGGEIGSKGVSEIRENLTTLLVGGSVDVRLSGARFSLRSAMLPRDCRCVRV
jgi:hypothetical protein